MSKHFAFAVRGFGIGAAVELFLDGAPLAKVASLGEAQYGLTPFRYNLANRTGALGVEVVNPGGARSQRLTIAIVKAAPPSLTRIFPPQAAFPGTKKLFLFSNTILPGAAVEVSHGPGAVVRVPPQEVNVIPLISSLNHDFRGEGGAYDFVITNPDGQRSAPFRFNVYPTDVVPVLTSALFSALGPNTVSPILLRGTNLAAGLWLEFFSASGAVVATVREDPPNGANSNGRIAEVGEDYVVAYAGLPATGQYGVEVVYPTGRRSNRLTLTVGP